MLVKNNKGLTLAEILGVLFVLSIVLIYAFQFISDSYKIMDSEMTKSEDRANLQEFTSILLTDLKYAKEIRLEEIDNKIYLDFLNEKNKSFVFIFSNDTVSMYNDSNIVDIFEINTINNIKPVFSDTDESISFYFDLRNFNIRIDYKINTLIEVSK